MKLLATFIIICSFYSCNVFSEIDSQKSEEFITVNFKGKKFSLNKNPGSGIYFGFNSTFSEPYIAFNGYDDFYDLSFTFSENQVKTNYNSGVVYNEFKESFKNKVFNPDQCGLSIEVTDNSKGLNEKFYYDFEKRSNDNKIEINEFEFKEGGVIKGVINCYIHGYNLSNRNQKELIQIEFSQKYDVKE